MIMINLHVVGEQMFNIENKFTIQPPADLRAQEIIHPSKWFAAYIGSHKLQFHFYRFVTK